MARAQRSPFLTFGEPALAPMAWTVFALKHPEQAVAADPRVLAPGTVAGIQMARTELARVNGRVNQGILPRPSNGDPMEPWLILPIGPETGTKPTGDCHDYAVTKRAMLLALGWPSSCLLLAEVIAPEVPSMHHLVVVARTSQGDLILDNLAPGTPLWWVRGFAWVRVQSPADPNLWCEVKAA